MMPILHIEPLRYPEEVRTLLASKAEVDYVEVADQQALIDALQAKPYRALFVRLGIAIDGAVFAAAPQLQYIVTPTTGLNHIDLEVAKERRVTTISLKGESEFLASIQSTSEHTWGLLLSLIRKTAQANASVQSGEWLREPFLGMELNGKTLSILGYGRLGRIVAGYGRAFGMRVLVNDTDPRQVQHLPEGIEAVNLPTLLQSADVLSLHIPYSAENRNFIAREELSQTKPGTVLLNTARGEVLEEKALLEFLISGHLRGAAIDVLDGDSNWSAAVPEGHPLVEYARTHDNLIITPHIGGYALESIEGTRAFVTKKFLQQI
jgi:D-3-phosphoglycerate dehydrogenase